MAAAFTWTVSTKRQCQFIRSQALPTGPKGQKRPADVIGNAIRVAKIATGEETETVIDDGKDKAAQALGKKGGEARAKSMSAKRRLRLRRKRLRSAGGRRHNQIKLWLIAKPFIDLLFVIQFVRRRFGHLQNAPEM